MARVCEICGGEEPDEDELTEVTSSIKLLFVCDGCRKERQPHDGQ